MTRQEAVVELQRIQSELVGSIDHLQSVAKEIDAECDGAKLLANYVVPHLRTLVREDDEFADLLPNLGHVIASLAR